MICDKIKDILKGGFLDGELALRERQFAEKHLAQCPACQAFARTLQEQRRLFQNAKRQDPPGYLWNNIKQEIIADQLRSSEGWLGRVVRWAKGLFFAPRSVFALGSTFAVIIFLVAATTGLAIYKKQINHAKSSAALLGYSINLESMDVLSDFGTDIEKFLL